MLEITIIGNVGSMRLAQAGETAVLNLSIAASRRVNDKEYTDWVAAKIWGERAEKLAEHLTKGAKLLLRGRPEAKGYQREDGTVAAELVLHANEVEFLSPKKREPEAGDLPLAESTRKPPRKKAA